MIRKRAVGIGGFTADYPIHIGTSLMKPHELWLPMWFGECCSVFLEGHVPCVCIVVASGIADCLHHVQSIYVARQTKPTRADCAVDVLGKTKVSQQTVWLASRGFDARQDGSLLDAKQDYEYVRPCGLELRICLAAVARKMRRFLACWRHGRHPGSIQQTPKQMAGLMNFSRQSYWDGTK